MTYLVEFWLSGAPLIPNVVAADVETSGGCMQQLRTHTDIGISYKLQIKCIFK